jgi:hypothetical protein
MSNSFNTPEGYEAIETSTLTAGRSWQCQESGCGKITSKPYRWVVGAKTTFGCDSCGGKVKVVGASENDDLLEEMSRKMTLLEQQVMALHQRMDDQCGKP